MQDSETRSRAPAEAATTRNVAANRDRKRKWLYFRALKKQIGGSARDRVVRCALIATNGDKIVKTQGDAEAIKSWSKVRCTRGNADCNVLHEASAEAAFGIHLAYKNVEAT